MAKERIKKLTAEHQPVPLDSDVQKELQALVDSLR
jgi:hypothetical protein